MDRETTFFIGGVSSGDSVEATFTFEVDDSFSGGSIEATGTLEGEETSTDTVTDDIALDEDDDGGDEEPPEGELPPRTTQLQSDRVFFVGQTLVSDAYDTGENVRLQRVDSDGDTQFVSSVTVRDGTISVDTTGRETGEYRIVSSDSSTEFNFELAEQEYEASADPTTVVDDGEGSTTDIAVSSNRDGYVHILESPQVDAETLESLIVDAGGLTPVREDTDGDGAEELALLGGTTLDEVTLDFQGAATGNYTVNFRVYDTGVSDSVTVTVEEADPGVAQFSSVIVSEERGDIAVIPVSLDNTNSATVTVGNDDVNYEVTLDVTDGNDDGSVVLLWNTDQAKRDDSAAFFTAATPQGEDEDSVTVVDASESFVRSDSRVAATGYPLSASVGGDETDVATVNLQEPSNVPVELESRRALPNIDDDDITLDNTNGASTVAKGDKLVLRHQVAGVFGYGVGSQGVSLNIVETNLDDNEEGALVDPSVLNLEASPSQNQILAIADTSSNEFEAGQDYLAVFEINSSANPYYDEDVTAVQEISIVERQTRVDTAGSDEIRIQAASGRTISGTATVADGTPLTVTVRSTNPDNPILESQQVTVEDGSFSATFDLSGANAGQEITVTVRGDGTRSNVEGVVTETANVNANGASITESGEVITGVNAFLPNGGFVTIHDSSLQDGAVLDSVRGTSKYFGPGQVNDISIALDDPYQGGSFTIIAMAHQDTNGNAVYDFLTSEGSQDGPYVLDGGAVVASAEVTVPTPTPTTTTTEPTTTEPTTTEPTTTEPTTTEPTTTETTTTNGSGSPGFGVAVALIALLAAALLATRRRDE